MDHQDWKPVTWNKSGEKSKGQSNTAFLNAEKRKGNVITTNKKNVSNSNNKTEVNVRKLESEEDTFKHPIVSLSMAKRIAQVRCEKKLTQKDLAMKLSLDVKIIQEYENGKAIPNPNIINKLEKALDAKLRDK